MNIDSFDRVKELITQSESDSIEFKETTGQLERGMETLCAFLNGSGGIILFGVNDKGKVIGQELGDKTKRDIAEAIRRIEPFAKVDVSYINIPDSKKYIIVLYVDAHNNMRPYSYKGRAYQRIESVTSIMSQDTCYNLLLLRGGKHSWESLINPELRIEDLDERMVMNAVRGGVRGGRLPASTQTESISDILEKFELLHNGKLNNAAAILFGKKFYNYPQCLLRMARFKGTTKDEFWDNQRVQGNIYDLLDAAMAFFFKHLSLSGKIEGLYREEELSVPYKALRECCINALAHRFYHELGGSISIAIYDDRIEVTNVGKLPSEMTIERLFGTHDSKPQNPIIASVLYKSTVLESWGRGIKLMVDECKRVGIPEPEFCSDNGFVSVTFHYTRITAGQVAGQVAALITCLGTGTLSSKELMEKLSLKGRDNFLKNYLRPALDNGFVEQTNPEKPNHPKQKYRVTNKGLRVLMQQQK